MSNSQKGPLLPVSESLIYNPCILLRRVVIPGYFTRDGMYRSLSMIPWMLVSKLFCVFSWIFLVAACGFVVASERGCQSSSDVQCNIVALVRNSRSEVSVRIPDDKFRFKGNDVLVFTISTGARKGYLTIAYIGAGDAVSYIARDDGPVGPRTVLRVGDGGPKRGSLFIKPPFGNEMILVLVSPKPIFGGEKAPETARDLRGRLQALGSARGQIEAAYVFIETGPEG